MCRFAKSSPPKGDEGSIPSPTSTYKFTYDNGEILFKSFESDVDAAWWAHNEGDHLLHWKRYDD